MLDLFGVLPVRMVIFNLLLNSYLKTINKTLIFISHKISSVCQSDKILVLKDGELVESGTHKQLLEKHGVYVNMFEKQENM